MALTDKTGVSVKLKAVQIIDLVEYGTGNAESYGFGDTQDDHIDHALCRLMMAYATEKSENFNYNTYIPKS